MTINQIPFVREAEASGLTADIFADIRDTMDAGSVNLIWRHLAVDVAVLESAWQATRPFYKCGVLDEYVRAFVAQLNIDSIGYWPDEVLQTAGVSDDDRPVVAAIFDAYNRGNAYNLLTLSALLVEPDTTVNLSDDAGVTLPSPAIALPPLPEIHELDTVTASLVLTLNQLGSQSDDQAIIASLYKHLAPWPGLLNLVWAVLEPMHRDGRLQALVDHTSATAATCAGKLAGYRGTWPAGNERDSAQRAIQPFVQHVISRLLPIGLLLRPAINAD